MRRINWKVALLALAIAIALRAYAHATVIHCMPGVDVSQAANAALASGTSVEFDGSGCLLTSGLNMTVGTVVFPGNAPIPPTVDGHNLLFTASTGQFPVIDLTEAGWAHVSNMNIFSGGANPSIYGVRMGPGTGCNSYRGQNHLENMTIDLTPSGQPNGSIAFDLEISEQNQFTDIGYVQADVAVEISGVGATLPKVPSAYHTPCTGLSNHTAIGNSFLNGQFTSDNGPTFLLDGGGIFNLGVYDSVLAWPGVGNKKPGRGAAIVTNHSPVVPSSGPYEKGEWFIQARVEEWSSLIDGPVPGDSQFIVPVRLTPGAVPTPAVKPWCPSGTTLTPATAGCL